PELNSTGTPLKFDVLYDALTYEPRDIEQKVHAALSSCRVGKEWFRCDPWSAVIEIRRAAGDQLLAEALHAVEAPKTRAVNLVEVQCPHCRQMHTFEVPPPSQIRCTLCLELF